MSATMVGAAMLVMVASSRSNRSAMRTTMSMLHINVAEVLADGVGALGVNPVGGVVPGMRSEVMDIGLTPFERRIRCHQKSRLVGDSMRRLSRQTIAGTGVRRLRCARSKNKFAAVHGDRVLFPPISEVPIAPEGVGESGSGVGAQ